MIKAKNVNIEPRTERIQKIFDAIARRYDLLNRLMSFGIDKRWRKRLVQELAQYAPEKILDIAVGTADLSLDMAKGISSLKDIIGVDISTQMLEVGRVKVREEGFEKNIKLQEGNCESLPFNTEFNAVTCAFGVRNFEKLEQSLAEMHRVLLPNGQVAILELSIPRNFFLRLGYTIWTRFFVPIIGRLFAKNREAYTYLPLSVRRMPQYDQFQEMLENAGFQDVSYKALSGGIATLYIGKK